MFHYCEVFMRVLLLAMALNVVTTLPAAASWHLVSCGADRVDEWARHRRVLLEATVESPHYLPKPFPRNSAEVIEDYRYELRRLWPTRADVPENMRSIYDGVQSNALRFDVVQVENWMPERCGRQSERSRDYLIRLTRMADGVELGRTTLGDDGFWMVQVPAGKREPSESIDENRAGFMELAEALERVHADFGVEGREPQYVSVAGAPLRCESFAPCVAFRVGDDVYLVSPKLELVRLPAGARRVDKEMGTGPRMSAVGRLGLGPDEGVISLGGEAFAVAHRVGRLQRR
jgi:hypothetical protein